MTVPVLSSDIAQNLRGMFLRLDLVIGLGDLALLIDQERHAVDAVEFAAHELFQPPDPEGFGQGVILVHEKREGQVELVSELLVGFGCIARHPEDLDFFTFEAIPKVTEATGLGGATGGVVSGIEVEQEAAPLQVGA